MVESYSHFAMFGASRPSCVDEGGCLRWREGFEKLDQGEWTEAERWVYSTEKIAKLGASLKALADAHKARKNGPVGTVREGGYGEQG